jgi:class 3 adenylate cyclase
MEMAKTRYARSSDGASIAYQVWGDGPFDLLWLSPWFSHLEMMWEFPPVAQLYSLMGSMARTITFDQRGIGLSDRTKGIPDLETRVDDLQAVLDEVGSERTVLWGAGADGGALCAMFAATHPDRVLALATWNAMARTAWAPDYPWGMTAEYMRSFDEMVHSGWGLEEHAAEIIREGGAPPELADDPAWTPWVARVMRNMAAPGDLVVFDQMWDSIDYRAILSAIHVPALIMHTDDQIDGTAEESAWIASQIPGARLATFEDLGYFPPWPGHSESAVGRLRDLVREVRDEEAELDRVLATVLFTDIVNSTSTAAVMGDAKWRDLLAEHDRIAKGLIARYRGTYRKSTGDGLMATFDGPARAVRCAQALTEAVKPLGIEIRAGAHTGEVTFGEHDLAGLGVHVAARVADMAGDSEVWASSTVKDLTAGSGLTFEDAGEHELKGVPDTWRLFRVVA